MNTINLQLVDGLDFLGRLIYSLDAEGLGIWTHIKSDPKHIRTAQQLAKQSTGDSTGKIQFVRVRIPDNRTLTGWAVSASRSLAGLIRKQAKPNWESVFTILALSDALRRRTKQALTSGTTHNPQPKAKPETTPVEQPTLPTEATTQPTPVVEPSAPERTPVEVLQRFIAALQPQQRELVDAEQRAVIEVAAANDISTAEATALVQWASAHKRYLIISDLVMSAKESNTAIAKAWADIKADREAEAAKHNSVAQGLQDIEYICDKTGVDKDAAYTAYQSAIHNKAKNRRAYAVAIVQKNISKSA
jgi:NACalpha-BTF3-like transcription factor